MTIDDMMRRKGFLPTDTGPYVTKLREVVSRQMESGLVNCSAGTWGPGSHDAETRAKAFLAVEWEIAHGQTYEVKSVDPPITRTFNTKTMRPGWRVDWSEIMPWLGDRFRALRADFRRWRNQRNGVSNPFA